MDTFNIIYRSLKNIKHGVIREPCLFLVDIHLTYYCTQRCLQCSYPIRAPNMKRISLENFKHIINVLDRYGTQSILFSGGEPLLHPQLAECIEYAASKRFSYMHILTSLYASRRRIEELTKNILRHRVSISCSFDGFGKIADTLRGAKDVSGIVLENMDYVGRENRKLGAPIRTIATIVVSPMNMNQVPEILECVEKIGWLAALEIYRPNDYYPRDDGQLVIKEAKELKRIIEIAKASRIMVTPSWLLDGFVDKLSGRFPKYCPYILSPSIGSRFFVQPDGTVNVCLNNKIGNLLYHTPEEILKTQEWKYAQTTFNNCQGCWNSCFTLLSLFSNYNIKNIIKFYRQTRFIKRMAW